MFPDDFFGPVSLQSFGAIVPADYVPKRIQVDDGVFLNALNQQPESFLTLALSLFRLFAIRNIFKSNADEILPQGENLDSIDALSDPLITIRNLSQVSWLARLKDVQASSRQPSLKELWEFRQRSAAQIFCSRPSEERPSGVDISNSKGFHISRIL